MICGDCCFWVCDDQLLLKGHCVLSRLSKNNEDNSCEVYSLKKDLTMCKKCKFNIKVKSKRVEYFCTNPYYEIAISKGSGKCKFYEDINKQSNEST